MNSTYGNVKSAFIDPQKDVEIFYHYRPTLNSEDINYFDGQEGTNVSKSNEIQIQQKELEEIYGKLLSKRFDFKKWIDSFSSFSDKHERILYSILSGMILNEKKELFINNLELNLDIINSKITKSDEESKGLIRVSEDTYKLYYKFFDHCSLAIAQRRIYNQSDDMSKERTEKIVKQQMQEAIDKRVLEYEKNITGQLIGLISIFTALSFVIFGGINVLESLVDNISNAPIGKLLFLAAIWFICMFNVLFVFVKFIAALTSRTIERLWIYFTVINFVLIALLIIVCSVFKIRIGITIC